MRMKLILLLVTIFIVSNRALSCSPLIAPRNGSIMCTSDRSVGSTCNFQCDPGFTLVGSTSRICLPSLIWSGEEVICQPMLCEELASPANGFVIFPCTREYGTSCRVACGLGYSISGPSSRSCILQGTEVAWTEEPSCIESDVCRSEQPCRHNGTCSSDGTQFTCDCTGTGYTGPTCDTVVVSVSSIPSIKEGETSSPITISAVTDITIEVEINIESDAVIPNPSSVIIIPPATEGSFTLNASDNSEGLHTITYQVKPSIGITVADSVVLVTAIFRLTPPRIRSLQPGSCRDSNPSYQCPMSGPDNQVSLTSYCTWTEDSGTFTTAGVVFAENRQLQLPVSILGVIATTDPVLSAEKLSGQLLNCAACGQQIGYTFNSFGIQGMLEGNVITESYISKLHSFQLTPMWISRFRARTLTTIFDEYDYGTSLVNADSISEMKGCENVVVADPMGLYLVLQTRKLIQVQTSTTPSIRLSHQSTITPLCLAVNLCKDNQSPLYIGLSNEAQETLLKSDFLSDFDSRSGWSITLHSLTLSRSGISAPADTAAMYWNGITFFDPASPFFDIVMSTETQAKLEISMLTISIKFNGKVYYRYLEREGVLEGKKDFDVEVASTILGSKESIKFIATAPAIVNIPTTVIPPDCSQLGQKLPGVAMKLSYQLQSGSQFFLRLLTIIDDNIDCSIDAFMNLDGSRNLEAFSFRSECLQLTLGSLMFPKMIQTFRFFGSDNTGLFCLHSSLAAEVRNSSLLINAMLSEGSSGRLGTFLEMKNSNSLALSVVFGQQSNSIVGRLQQVSVSILGANFDSTVEISNNALHFATDTQIYGQYGANLMVTAPLNDTASWDRVPFTVKGSLDEEFEKNIEDRVNIEFEVIGSEADQRLQTLTNALNQAEQQLQSAEIRFNISRENLASVTKSHTAVLQRVEIALSHLATAENAFGNANTQLQNELCTTGFEYIPGQHNISTDVNSAITIVTMFQVIQHDLCAPRSLNQSVEAYLSSLQNLYDKLDQARKEIVALDKARSELSAAKTDALSEEAKLENVTEGFERARASKQLAEGNVQYTSSQLQRYLEIRDPITSHGRDTVNVTDVNFDIRFFRNPTQLPLSISYSTPTSPMEVVSVTLNFLLPDSYIYGTITEKIINNIL